MLNTTYSGISTFGLLTNFFLLVYSTHYITLALGKAGRYNSREVEHTTHQTQCNASIRI